MVGRRDSLIDEAGLAGPEGLLRPSLAMLRGVGVQNQSPLGLSNYDALDEEDVWVEVEADEGEEAETCLAYPDFGLPQPTQELVTVEKEEVPVQPEETYNPNPLDLSPRSPNFVVGHADVTSPNVEWLTLTTKTPRMSRTNMGNGTLSSLGFTRKSLPDCRQDAMMEIKREQERQRRLFGVRFE
jgi:hypothetical protein